MTREEFNKRIIEQYKKFESSELEKTPLQIFYDSWEISKIVAIKDYFVLCDYYEIDNKIIEKCFPYADTILNDLNIFEEIMIPRNGRNGTTSEI